MSDPRDYVPPDIIIRATVDAPRDLDGAACPARPWTVDGLRHVAECEHCQATLDGEAASRDGYDDALAYLPSEILVARVLLASTRPRYRVRLLDELSVARERQRSPGKRIVASLTVWALSPAVLAAAVVAHVAIAIAMAGVTVFSISAPQRQVAERVDFVPLPVYRALLPEDLSRKGAARALAALIAQEVDVATVLSGLPSLERERLDSTIARLRQNRGARVLLRAENSRDALSAAEIIGRYLIERGVERGQVRIVAGGASAGRVVASLDTAVTTDRPAMRPRRTPPR